MLNRCTISGRLTRDPELKYTQAQVPVVSFSVAVDRDFVRQGEQRETDFLNVVAWRSTAEFVAKWFHKGSLVTIDGKLQTRRWEDKYQQKRTEVEIVAESVYFGSTKGSSEEVAEHIHNQVATNAQAALQGYMDGFRPLEDDGEYGSCPF